MSGDDTVQPVTIAEVGAWVAFAEGRYDLARERAHTTGELFHQALLEARILAARCALLAGDRVAAGEDLAVAAASGRRGRTVVAERSAIEAGLAALEGRPRDAMALYREALRESRDLGAVWDEALCTIDMAMLLDPSDPEVMAAAESGRAILLSLGATPFLERLETALAGHVAPNAATAPSAPAPATPA